MVFSSYIFIFYFLSVALLSYYATPVKFRHLTLTILSYIFYGWSQPWYIILIILSTIVDYLCGKLITNKRSNDFKRKLGVIISVFSNLSLLGFFKYTTFFITNINIVQKYFGYEALMLPPYFYSIVLPVGISFYSFQSMSYSIDLYRGEAKPARNFIDFACYVSMFPQLIAGPIVRYQTIADQLRYRLHSFQGFTEGFTRFNYGFAKKILLANVMGQIADPCFSAAENGALSPITAWVGIVAYALQIYFDFSAYSDMALGLGKMFGFNFLENFNSPYKSKSITEFWRRWHISLSTFLRDYLYIPLGGNRISAVRTYVNLMLVMFIGGLWHGASWNFVVWGTIHGLMLALERFFNKWNLFSFVPSFIRLIFTFAIVNITWVFFRAENFSVAYCFLKSMFFLNEFHNSSLILDAQIYRPFTVFFLLIGIFIVFCAPNVQDILKKLTVSKIVIGLILFIISISMMCTQDYNPFLYFQF